MFFLFFLVLRSRCIVIFDGKSIDGLYATLNLCELGYAFFKVNQNPKITNNNIFQNGHMWTSFKLSATYFLLIHLIPFTGGLQNVPHSFSHRKYWFAVFQLCTWFVIENLSSRFFYIILFYRFVDKSTRLFLSVCCWSKTCFCFWINFVITGIKVYFKIDSFIARLTIWIDHKFPQIDNWTKNKVCSSASRVYHFRP